MLKKPAVQKFLFRLLVVNVVFFLVKATMEHTGESAYSFYSLTSLYYYFTTFFLFMVTWEYNDWLLDRRLKNYGLDLRNSLRIFALSMGVLIFFSVIFYYIVSYPLGSYLRDPGEVAFTCFLRDLFRAALLGFAVISFNMFYHTMKQRDQMKKQLEDLKKEMLASKYVSLKNQISPHFLFNSMNTLTSLMYEDRDLASDFLSRLASSYRYILENTEEDLVSLKKELNFLDSYIFMMNVRHEGSLKISVEIPLDAENFLVPTLCLQMLFENALKHNYFSKEKPLKIRIYSVGKIGVVVENTLRKRINEEESTKLGLNNIKKRYSYYTNQEVAVEIDEAYFKVTIPLLHKSAKKVSVLSVS